MTTATLTAEQIQELREEFIDFKINEMTHDEMADWIRTVYLGELNRCTLPEIKEEIDRYDDFLYDILVSYVKDEENSYEILQEFIHERHENDWINDV